MKASSGTIAIGLAAIAILGQTLPVRAELNQEAIDAVASGRLTIAKASWWGFDAAESTGALQSAIDSGARKVIVENMGTPWIVDKIQLAGDQEIVFQDGVVVQAKRGAFKGRGDSLFTASLKQNITLSGYGATFRMHKADYIGLDYEKAEWRHTLTIRSCSDICVHGLTLAESGGDGIYLGVAQEGVTNTNIHIKDVVCDRNHRQGVSVISAENLFMENCILRDTSGTAPMAGIDFEPNHPSEKLVNCTMRNCVVQNNQGDGFEFYLKNLTGASDEVSISIEHCRSIGNRTAVRIVTTNGHPDGDVGGAIVFRDCTFHAPSGPGIMVAQKPAEGCHVRFGHCDIRGAATDTPQQAPIVLSTRPGDTRPMGGVTLADVVISDSVDRPPITLQDWAGAVRIADLNGRLVLESGETRDVVRITPERLAEWMPTLALEDIPPFDTTGIGYRPLRAELAREQLATPSVKMRKQALFLLYAEKGDTVGFTVSYGQVARYSARPMPVRVTTPSGESVPAPTAEFLKDNPVTFTAPERGVYRIECDAGQNYVQVRHADHPVCVTSESGPVRLYQSAGDLFFWVPADATRFAIKCFGENAGEGLKAELYNASDELVEDRDNITRPHQFVVDRTPAARGEVWRLHTARPTDVHLEDYHVQLQGLPPMTSWTRDGLLVPDGLDAP